jgi:hypothetical protein
MQADPPPKKKERTIRHRKQQPATVFFFLISLLPPPPPLPHSSHHAHETDLEPEIPFSPFGHILEEAGGDFAAARRAHAGSVHQSEVVHGLHRQSKSKPQRQNQQTNKQTNKKKKGKI